MKLSSRGKIAARKLSHAKVLLHADEALMSTALNDTEIAKAIQLSVKSVERIRKRFVEEGIESALNPKVQQRRRPKRLDGKAEAFLVPAACSDAPAGRSSWTLQLLADRLVECEIVDTISTECVRQTLKKMNLSLG